MSKSHFVPTGLHPSSYGAGRGSSTGSLQVLGRDYQRGKGKNAHTKPHNRQNAIARAVKGCQFTSEAHAANHVANLYVNTGMAWQDAIRLGRAIAAKAFK
jgi:hypothetical protein